jgi:UDP-2,3-diacylglucosamine pyrophosphatase LpxH
MVATLEFDQLHVISDLHLGGVKPFQIFGSTVELVSLITYLAQQPEDQQVGLLINGDFIDFLAEEPGAYFDPERAVDKLDRVLGDASFAPVFAAMRAFVRADHRVLVINLGNHDLELALPWVREHLIQALCGDELPARARLRLVQDGTGVLCRVGGAKVLCVHGNEVDSWNVADFERVRRITRDLQFGKSVDAWIPNAGTQMVIDVMNGIKRRYPFVDLLKPEAEGVVPALVALDPSALNKLRAVAAVAGRVAWDAARMSTGFLGDGPAGATGVPPGTPSADATFRAARAPHESRGIDSAESARLMELVERELSRGTDPIDLVRGDVGQQLGFWSAAWGLATGKPSSEALREAFELLDADRSFDIGAPDDTYARLDRLVAPDIDYVVAGHTHLERALPRQSGRGYYFNSGTWARLIRIDPDVRRSPERFERVFRLFQGGSMEALDAEPGLVIKRCSVVSIGTGADGRAYGELRHMQGAQLVAVEHSRYPGD